MFQSIEPNKEEQLVTMTVDGLRQLEDLYIWDFSRAISDALWLFDCHGRKAQAVDAPLTGEQLRSADGVCPRHGLSLVIAEYGNPDSDMVCPECEREIQEQS